MLVGALLLKPPPLLIYKVLTQKKKKSSKQRPWHLRRESKENELNDVNLTSAAFSVTVYTGTVARICRINMPLVNPSCFKGKSALGLQLIWLCVGEKKSE